MGNSVGSKLGRLIANVDLKALLALLAIFGLCAIFWDTFIVLPLKIFVVLLHEVSHGLAAIFSGGEIVRIEINSRQGGVCYSRGGSRFLVLSAGYLGSMLWGALILLLSTRSKADRIISVAFGGFLGIVTLLYVRSWFGFGFSLAAAAFLVLMGLKLSQELNEFVLKVIGVTSCLYAVLDIVDDVMKRPGIGSDADMLAELTMIPSVVWGAIWIVLAVVVTAVCLLLGAQRKGPGVGKAG